MIVTAHQPVYLPWLGLFHKISLADIFVSYDHVRYSSRDFTARNSIKISQGKKDLIVPIKKRSTSKEIINLEIDYTVNWQNNHWKTIQSAYGKTQYFSDYSEYFEHFYKTEWKYISEMNNHLLRYLLNTLGFKTEIIHSTDLNIVGDKNEGIIDMCKKLKADSIVFGSQGKDYVNKNLYKENNIGIYFQNYNHPTYEQKFSGFYSHLSVIDLLFNHGPESKNILLQGNEDKEKIKFN